MNLIHLLPGKWGAIKNVACSQTLYFLFKVHRARVIKYKPQGSYWPPAQGGGGVERRKCYFSFSRARRCFLKRTKRRIKQRLFTGYGYRLIVVTSTKNIENIETLYFMFLMVSSSCKCQWLQHRSHWTCNTECITGCVAEKGRWSGTTVIKTNSSW